MTILYVLFALFMLVVIFGVTYKVKGLKAADYVKRVIKLPEQISNTVALRPIKAPASTVETGFNPIAANIPGSLFVPSSRAQFFAAAR